MQGSVVAGIRGSSEINALSAGTSGWWISGSYRQDTMGNFSGSVPPVIRPPVTLGSGVPPTFQLMVFPTEWVFEGDTIPIYGLVALPVAFAPISPASGGGVNYLLDFQSNAWFEIKVDPN